MSADPLYQKLFDQHPLDGLHTAWVTVTPALADEMLRRNEGNRSVRRLRVNRYARAMLSNRWFPTGDAIGFTSHGRLLNGQHRLRAIVAADLPVVCLVVWGVTEESFKVWDRGGVRSPGDVAAAAGFDRELSADASNAARYAMGILHVWSGATTDFSIPRLLDADEVADWLVDHEEEMVESVTFGRKMKSLRRPGLMAAFHFCVGKTNQPWLEDVLKRASTGIGIESEHDPAWHIKKICDSMKTSRTSNGEMFLLSKAIIKGISGRLGKRVYKSDGERLPDPPFGWMRDAIYPEMDRLRADGVVPLTPAESLAMARKARGAKVHKADATLEKENARLREELEKLKSDGNKSSARHARIARAASRAAMTVSAWIDHCTRMGTNPEVFRP